MCPVGKRDCQRGSQKELMPELLSWSLPDKGDGEWRVFPMKITACAKAQGQRDLVCSWHPTTIMPVELIRQGGGSGITKLSRSISM